MRDNFTITQIIKKYFEKFIYNRENRFIFKFSHICKCVIITQYMCVCVYIYIYIYIYIFNEM